MSQQARRYHHRGLVLDRRGGQPVDIMVGDQAITVTPQSDVKLHIAAGTDVRILRREINPDAPRAA